MNSPLSLAHTLPAARLRPKTLVRVCRINLTRLAQHSHFLIQFDTNPRVLNTLSARYRADPRVIKWTTLKLGEQLHEITPNVNASRASSLDARQKVSPEGEETEIHGAVDRGQMGGRRTINAAQGY